MNPGSPAKKRGLGRGLDALLQKEEAPPPGPVQTLPVASLRPNRFQPRTQFDDAAIEELAESIRAQGVIQPLVVARDAQDPQGAGYVIVAGERRWRASRRAGLETVPVVVREVADDQELLELALVENLQRSDLSPLEEAEAYLMLQEKFSLSQEAIAHRVGKARTTVSNSLRLLRLPEEVRDLLRDGHLSAGQARPLLGMATSEEQISLAERAVREGLSARDMERLAAEPRSDATAAAPKKKPARTVEVHAAAAQEKLTRRLQTKVEIRRRGKGGVLQISFHSEEELMRLYDVLMDRGDDQ